MGLSACSCWLKSPLILIWGWLTHLHIFTDTQNGGKDVAGSCTSFIGRLDVDSVDRLDSVEHPPHFFGGGWRNIFVVVLVEDSLYLTMGISAFAQFRLYCFYSELVKTSFVAKTILMLYGWYLTPQLLYDPNPPSECAEWLLELFHQLVITRFPEIWSDVFGPNQFPNFGQNEGSVN